MNRSPWMNRRRWRLEEVDGGDEQCLVQSCFAVRHTPPDEQDPRFDRSAPTQVGFLRFAIHHTPPDEHDPVSTVGTRIERSFPPFCSKPDLVLAVSSKPVGSR